MPAAASDSVFFLIIEGCLFQKSRIINTGGLVNIEMRNSSIIESDAIQEDSPWLNCVIAISIWYPRLHMSSYYFFNVTFQSIRMHALCIDFQAGSSEFVDILIENSTISENQYFMNNIYSSEFVDGMILSVNFQYRHCNFTGNRNLGFFKQVSKYSTTSLIIENCLIRLNQDLTIALPEQLTLFILRNTVFEGNNNENQGFIQLYTSYANITNCYFISNSCKYCAFIHIPKLSETVQNKILISNSVFQNSSSSGLGSCLFMEPYTGAEISNTVFSKCSAPFGGCIYSMASTLLNISNCTFLYSISYSSNGGVIFLGTASTL